MNLYELKQLSEREAFPELKDTLLMDSVWQYLIDHSSVTMEGKIQIHLDVEDKKDFLRKVRTRYNNPSYKKQEYTSILKKIERKRKMKLTWRHIFWRKVVKLRRKLLNKLITPQ